MAIDAKDHYGINCLGGFWVQRVATLPAFSPDDQGREIFVTATGRRYVGGLNGWVEFQMGGSQILRWPEIFTTTNRLFVSGMDGVLTDLGDGVYQINGTTVLVPNNHKFNMRGALYETDAVSGDKSFATATNNTYHLRFVHESSSGWRNMTRYAANFYTAHGITDGHFYLASLAETTYEGAANKAYNPGGIYTDASVEYDSWEDDMIVAKVINNGGVVTVIPLANSDNLFARTAVAYGVAYSVDAADWAPIPDSAMVLNWGRKPRASSPIMTLVRSKSGQPSTEVWGSTEGNLQMAGVRDANVTRYGGSLEYVYRDSEANYGTINAHWVCQA